MIRREDKSFEGPYQGQFYCILKIRNKQNSVSINGDVNAGLDEVKFIATSKKDAAKVWLALKTVYKSQKYLPIKIKSV